MKIGIDARLINQTGVGRYIRNLISGIAASQSTDSFILYLRKSDYDAFVLPDVRFEKRLADIHWHTVKEQIEMPKLFSQDHLDLVHIPYFNVPIFYPGKIIVTIHDLTILHFPTGKATTLPLPLYAFKWLGYYLLLLVGLLRAVHIIAVSKATKHEIMSHFPLSQSKISVTYEGVDAKVLEAKPHIEKKWSKLGTQPFFLYVGNAYPHKNLDVLCRAYEDFSSHDEQTHLVLVGREDIFYRTLKKKTDGRILFFGEAANDELSWLYQHAKALVFPSKMEGFGLPALEAASFGCPLILSDIPVFRELFGEIAAFVPVGNVSRWSEAMAHVEKQDNRKEKIKHVLALCRWDKLVSDTLEIYARCTGV